MKFITRQFDFIHIITSKDKGKNRYGNFLLDFCKGNNVFIMNGRLGKDQIGNLTCRNTSVVDYCLSLFFSSSCIKISNQKLYFYNSLLIACTQFQFDKKHPQKSMMCILVVYKHNLVKTGKN
jgi:hypothetical protein